MKKQLCAALIPGIQMSAPGDSGRRDHRGILYAPLLFQEREW